MKNTSITLKQILLDETQNIYGITGKLFKKVTNDDLVWKPASGTNWMTTGQLLMHCANFGCGKAVRGFVRGDWGLAENDTENIDVKQHVPPVSVLPAVQCVKEACYLLEQDKILAVSCINEVKEEELLTKKTIAPWGGPKNTLFQHLMLMIAHLVQHKGQLFYYLKLMGRDVNTQDLWG